MSLTEVIAGTKAAVASNEKVAHVVYRATHDVVGATEVTALVGSGHEFTIDEPKAIGGGNVAPSPVEYALAALGSCQAITYQFWAAHLGIALDAVHVDVEGDLDIRRFFGIDDSVRAGFGAVRVQVQLSGPESEERYQELAAAVDEHCPVLDLFSNPVPVQRELLIN